MRPEKIRLGEILVSKQLISQEELDRALAKGKQTGRKLGRVLVESGRLSEPDIGKAVASQLGFPFVELQSFSLAPELVGLLPEALARRYVALLVGKAPTGRHQVAMSDPADVFAYDEITKILAQEFDVLVATETDVFQGIERGYKKTENIQSLAGELSREVSEDVFDFAQLQAPGSEDAPVVRLLQSIFEDAVSSRASDVHIEPMERKLLIRFRIDGALHLRNEADSKIAAAVAQRLKLISGLNISEKRTPQDGRFNMRVHKNLIDVRIATSPISHGEAIVMRILNQNAGLLALERLGMPEHSLHTLREALDRPQGMILVTGPTGSGKTTTLYGSLNALNRPDTKIITVEDPVEYRIEGVNQMQVHEKIGMGFNTALRSILRQDPDVILIGEMRDKETVDAALRASMTGHLVLSTLHTNDAASAPARLLDMGAERFMVASSLHLVIAQRLLRLNCPKCLKPHTPTDTEFGWLRAQFDEAQIKRATFMQSVGCPHCSGTGYYGRAGVYEMLLMDHELINSLYEHSIQSFTGLAHKKIAGSNLSANAALLTLKGLCTIAQARKIT